MEPAAQFGYWCSSYLLIKLIRTAEHLRKQKTGIDTRCGPVSSLPSSEPKHLYILIDIVGLSTFEEALVMPCSNHGEGLSGDFLDCAFKSCERMEKVIVERGR